MRAITAAIYALVVNDIVSPDGLVGRFIGASDHAYPTIVLMLLFLILFNIEDLRKSKFVVSVKKEKETKWQER